MTMADMQTAVMTEANTALVEEVKRLRQQVTDLQFANTAEVERRRAAEAERVAYAVACESLVCEVPGSSISADMHKAAEYGRKTIAALEKERDEARADWLDVARVVDRVHDQSMGASQPGTREEVLGAVCALKNEVQRIKDARHEAADAIDEQTGGRSVSELLESEKQLQLSLKAAGKEIERLTGELGKLKDPNAVHVNLLRGSIARPSWGQILHVYTDEAAEIERLQNEVRRSGAIEPPITSVKASSVEAPAAPATTKPKCNLNAPCCECARTHADGGCCTPAHRVGRLIERAEKAEAENAKLSQGLHEKTQEVRDLLVLRTENAELRHENAKLRDENLLLAGRLAASVCHECGGRGELILDCTDPQCGDSTWDHNCTAGRTKPCPNKSHGAPTPHQAYLRAAVDLAEAVAEIRWDDATTYEGNIDASMHLSVDQLRAVQATLVDFIAAEKAGRT